MKTKEELIRIYSAYLPYGLELQIEEEIETEYTMFLGEMDSIMPGKAVLIGITKETSYMPECLLFTRNDGEPDGYTQLKNVKPILYDLSYLTKEIEHEGERFVPIIKLMKMLNINGEMFEIEDGVMGYGWDEKYGDDAQGYAVGWDYDLKCFVVGYSDDINYETGIDFEYDHNSKSKYLYELPFSYDTFQKLLEWNFNVFSLAEGEYINKATLK